MKILNSSFADHIPGAPELYLSYMGDFFPAGQPRDKVYRDHLLALAQSWEDAGHKEVCGDIEYVTGAPESIIFKVTDATQRPMGFEVLAEIAETVKEVYSGRFGYYGRHASWQDYFGWEMAGRDDEFLQTKFDYFLTWENQLRTVSSTTDVLYPSVYGTFDKWVPAGEVVMYSSPFTLEDYRELQARCYDQIDLSTKLFHRGMKYRWFFTNNKTGQPYPEGNVDWQLEQLRKYKKPAVFWNGPHSKYVPLSDEDRGVIVGHNG